MAFRRPGIRVLERDAAGDPTVAQVIPFSERVVETIDGPRLLEEVRKLAPLERQRVTTLTVEPRPVRVPAPIRDRPAPIRTSQFIDRNRDGIDDRDQIGEPIEVEPSPIRDSAGPPPAFRFFGPPLLRCAPGFHVELGGTRSQRCVRDPIETIEEKEAEEVNGIAPPTEPPVGIESVIELPAEDGAAPSDGTSPGTGRNGDGGTPLVGVSPGGAGGFGGSGGGATVNVEAAPAGAPPLATGRMLPGGIVALRAVGLLAAGAVVIFVTRKGIERGK